jgi:ABC-type histidine transport system ATPase subunit
MNKLELTNIHKSYGSNEVLKGLSLSAQARDVISIIGSSGSGKSTFLRCINLLERPHEGEIALNGQQLLLKLPSLRSYKPCARKLAWFFSTLTFGRT